MILHDELVTLRAIEDDDAFFLQELINDSEIEKSVVGYSYPVSFSMQKKWIDNLSNSKDIRYAIDNGSGIVGVATVSSLDMKNRVGNLNIKLHKKARGKGYASHALKLLISYCFLELNLNCITANVIESNEDSKQLFNRLGFNLDGILRKRVFKNGKYNNLLAFSLLQDEFNERNWK